MFFLGEYFYIVSQRLASVSRAAFSSHDRDQLINSHGRNKHPKPLLW